MPFTDNFNDTNLTLLENHTPSGGTAWTISGGGAAGTFLIGGAGTLLRTPSSTPTVDTYYTCDDQGSADHYISCRFQTFDSTIGAYVVACRLVDTDNYIGVRLAGNGSGGLRITQCVAGVATDLALIQGENGGWVKLEVSGTTVDLYKGGTGPTPSWSVTPDATASYTANTTETSQGVLVDTSLGGAGATKAFIDDFEAGSLAAPPSDSITVTNKVAGTVIQRTPVTSNASVTISGVYVGSPTAVECRILDAADDLTEIVTWTILDPAPTDGNFSGSITVPEGGWYHAEVRFSNDTEVNDLQNVDWGVGIIVACWGQSNIEKWFTIGTGSPNALLSSYSTAWQKKSTGGAGAISFGNALIAEFGIPVGLIDSGVGGTQLTGGIDWGDDTASTYSGAVNKITAVGGKVESVLWVQGEADALLSVSSATYQTALETLITTRMRGDVTNGSDQTNLPFFIGNIGRRTDGVDADTQAIRTALKTVADGAIADVYFAAEMYDLPLVDTVHLTSAGYTTHGQRFAQAVIDILGTGTYHRGPQIASASQVDSTTVDVTLTHSSGSDFTPTSAITGFEVFDDATPLTVSAAVRQSATVIRLTVTPAIAGIATARYMYGANPTITGVVLDNSGLTLPLEMAGDTFAVTNNTDALLANGLQSLSQLSSPAVTSTPGVDALLANDLESSANVSIPSIGQTQVLFADNLQSLGQLSSPAVNRTFDQAPAMRTLTIAAESRVRTI